VKKYVASPEPHGEFLLPRSLDGGWCLVGEKSGRTYAHGLVVYVGREISESNVFAKAVDAGHQIPSTDALLHVIRCLFSAVQETKVGGQLRLDAEGVPHAA
jgi:hypothetical protein